MTRNPIFIAPQARRGMALPMVIVVLLVLSASFAGGVALARGERALDDAGKTGVLAQTYAETGLQRGIADRAALGLSGMPGASDSTRVTFSGGYYDVITTRLREAVGTSIPGLYFVRSHAVVTRTGVGGGPSAEYTVTQMATWTVGTMAVQSALTGYNGTDKAGAAGAISGVDQCPVGSGGSGVTLPAVAVPTTASDGGPGYDGSLAPLTGTPQVSYIGATPAAAAAASPIDWPGIYAGTSIAPTFTVNAAGATLRADGTLETNPAFQLDWATYWTTNPTDFPVIFVKNGPPNAGTEFILSSFGKGMLIVQDDIRLNGSTAGWDGVILVGGRLRTNGANRVQGATVSGLNTQMGYTPGPTDINDLNGTKQFLYDSCNVKQATNALGKLRVYRNTWSNSFKTF
ncbi:MAG: hypothetical protein C0497_09445 [Gemmatimonas sp.]|nr:hypothetical protein [Gemmatimonas sp.]